MAAGLVIDLGGPGKMPGHKPDLKSDSEQSAVQKFFEAGSSGDWAAATVAFKRAYDICSGESEPDTSDKGEDSEYGE